MTFVQGAPAIVLVGNKTDLASDRVVSREDGHALANQWKCSFLETSAKDRNSVNEVRDREREARRSMVSFRSRLRFSSILFDN